MLSISSLKFPGIWALVTLVMMWPAFLNGGAIWFHDSFAYFLVPNSLASELFGWSLQPFGRDFLLDGPPMAGRSPFYGAVVLLPQVLLGGFAVVALQAGLLSAAILLFVRAWLGADLRALLVSGLAVALLTPAPFFASYVMPDYLAGIAVLATLRFLLPAAHLGRGEGGFWWGALVFALVCHSSHVLLVAGLLVCVPVVQLVLRQSVKTWSLGLVAAALLTAMTGQAAQSAFVADQYGAAELQPPFLSARLIDDGPGYRYLAEHCPGADLELCNHVERLPLASDWFLWDKREETGVYQLASPEARRRMGEEQFRFARAVIAAYPASQARASLANLGEQLTRFSLREFAYNQEMRQRIDGVFLGERLTGVQGTLLYEGRFPLWPVSSFQAGLVLLSLGIAGLALWRGRSGAFLMLGVSFGLVLLGNATITGMLSTPHDRYQARLIWIVVLFVLMAWQGGVLRTVGAKAIVRA